MMQLAMLAMAACLPVSPDSDHVLARDLGAAVPAFAALQPETPVALAPSPGAQRVFHAPELRRLAARWQIEVPEQEVCVERPVKPLAAGRLLDAMQRQLPLARIAIRDYHRTPVPDGELDFPLNGLRMTSAGGLWTGAVRYGGTRRFAIWVRVEVSVVQQRVVAIEALQPGRPIEVSQLRLETVECFPSPEPLAATIGETAGKVPRRPIAAGTPICAACVEPAKVVARGDTVRVEVQLGGAYLEMPGRAESAGSAGQTIPVLNLETHRRFQARVAGKGRVSVQEGR